MYKFSNGVVVFDEKTRDEYINAGFKLIEEKKPIKEEINEEDDKDRTVDKESKRNKK